MHVAPNLDIQNSQTTELLFFSQLVIGINIISYNPTYSKVLYILQELIININMSTKIGKEYYLSPNKPFIFFLLRLLQVIL